MSVNAILKALIPFEVNDKPYYTIYFVHENDPGTMLEARIPADAIYPHPHVNDRVRVRYHFQVPTRFEKNDS